MVLLIKNKIHAKGFSNDRGDALVELVMVMMIMVLFGASVYAMIAAGSNAQEKIMRQKEQQVEARIALSYMNVRIRQNDARGKITIQPNGVNGQNAVLIRERDDEVFFSPFDRWIYWSDGVLKECMVDPGEPVNDFPGMYTPIAEVEGFAAEVDADGNISVTIQYLYGEAGNAEPRELSSVIHMRSYNDEAA